MSITELRARVETINRASLHNLASSPQYCGKFLAFLHCPHAGEAFDNCTAPADKFAQCAHRLERFNLPV